MSETVTTGSQQDIANRIYRALPGGWFSGLSVAPVLNGLLNGFGACFSWVYSLIGYANLQSRIATATGVFLDIIGLDYLGTSIVRKSGQTDASWRSRIQLEILAPKVTRPAMIQRLKALTGNTPQIFEPAFPYDTGGLTVGSLALGVAGGLGNINLPFQCFITVRRPVGQGISGYAGLGYMGLGYSGLADVEMLGQQITDADIYSAVANCESCATIPWTRITN